MPLLDDPYFSRVAPSEAEIIPRQDPVLWGGEDAAGPLNREQLAQYEREGYLFQPGLFTPEESEALLAEAHRLARETDPTTPLIITEPGDDSVVRTVFRIHRTSEIIKRVCQDERLAGVARQLLGSDVYVHQSRINFKPALDGKEFFWHSDFETWHIEDGMPRMRAVSMSLCLTPNTEFNGPLMVVPTSHQRYARCIGATPENHYQASLKKQQYGVPDRDALAALVEEGGIVAPKGPAGSVVFFESNTMHGSVGNLSPQPRINLFVVFNSVENHVTDPFGDRPPRPEFLAERELTPVDEL